MKKLSILMAIAVFGFVLPLTAFASVVNFNSSLYAEVNGDEEGGEMGSRDLVVGDFNGDGRDDFAIDSGNTGSSVTLGTTVHIVQGKKADISDGKIGSTDRYSITITDDYDFIFQKAAGDLNGDGYDDLAVYAYSYGNSKMHIFYGSSSLPTSNVAVTSSDITIGINDTMNNITFGDLDGDGKDEVLVNDFFYDTDDDLDTPYLGKIYGFSDDTLNNATSTVPLSSADFTITGARAQGNSPDLGKVMRIRDIDDDGKNDILIGAPDYNEEGHEEAGKEVDPREGIRMGAVYVIYGDNTLLTGDSDIDDITDARFTGDSMAKSQYNHPDDEYADYYLKWLYYGDQMGSDILTGDLNGDNKTDLIIGSLYRWDFGEYTGGLYVVYGTGSKLSGDQPIKTTYDVLIQPSSGHASNIGEYGWTGVGDVNNDGVDDILFNGFETSSGDRYPGLIYGGKNHNALTGQVGADSADMIYKFNDDTFNSTLLDLDGDNKLDFIFSSGNYDDYKTNAGKMFIGYNNSELVGPRVTAGLDGKIRIRNYNGKITKKKVFNKKYSGRAKVVPHNNSYIILHQKGRRLAVVDDEFEVVANQSISSVSWKYGNVQVFDLKDNDTLDIIATKKRATNNRVRTQTFRWNGAKDKLIKRSGYTIHKPAAKVKQTRVRKGKVIVRDSSRDELKEYDVLESGKLKP